MTQHYRAQFQTEDGRTYAVVDDQPITLTRLRLAEALLTGRVQVGQHVQPLMDLSTVPVQWLMAAAQVQA